jgi:hypothetical protein
MAKLTDYQFNVLKALSDGKVILRGPRDIYFWEDNDSRCSVVARRLVSKGYVRPVFLNALRDSVELTDAGRQVLMNELAKEA